MEKSDLSNSQKTVPGMSNQILLLYHTPINNLSPNIVYHNINELDSCNIENFKHIIIQDLLDSYDDKNIESLLKIIYDRMTTDSKIEVQGIDLKQLCVAVANDDIDEQLAKNILYSRKNINNIYDIQDYFKNCGFTISIRRYINIFEYNIVGIK